jgi:ATP-dependent RNA helicase RhlE
VPKAQPPHRRMITKKPASPERAGRAFDRKDGRPFAGPTRQSARFEFHPSPSEPSSDAPFRRAVNDGHHSKDSLVQSFSELDLIEPILRAVTAENYTTPTPIQAQAIPHLLAGRDLQGCAQTGTGKTAAFALPMLQRLGANAADGKRPTAGPRRARSLILTPTRELAIQIGESFRLYGKFVGLRQTVIYGGVGQKPQVDAMARGVDVLIATPGRLLDLMEQGHVVLDRVEIFVLDEADRMLDMGFIHDIRKVIKTLPQKRQTLFFSATMPPDIARLAASILKDPVEVAVNPVASTAERIDQRVLFVDRGNKRALLASLLADKAIERALVFTRTKHGANRVAEDLEKGRVSAEAIHGNKSQSARQRALENFRSGRTRILVATDIAARGIDIDGISHVINFDLPNEPESYVHRIGRTARAGTDGIAISFCDSEERAFLRDIEKLINRKVPVVTDHPYPAGQVPVAAMPADHRPPRSGRPGGNRNGNGGRPPQNRQGPARQGQGRPSNDRPADRGPAATARQSQGQRPSSWR